MATMHRRDAFTIIELLVSIAVIAALIALLMPAVQAAREAARRSACKNNLRQIGQGLHVYHDVHRSLPVGCIEWRSWNGPATHRQYAWSALLLPFIEQQNLHAEIDFDLPFDHPDNSEPAARRIALYECPSAPDRQPKRGPTSYGGLFGERINDWRPDDGVFLHERRIALSDIRDGLSTTLAVAEDVGGPDSEWINGRNVFVQSHGINDPTAWIGDNEIRSKHPSGAMLLFADAHVEFVSESLDLRLLGSIITRAKSEAVDAQEL